MEKEPSSGWFSQILAGHVRRHTGAREAMRQLVCEKHVGALGSVVRANLAVAADALQVVEVDQRLPGPLEITAMA